MKKRIFILALAVCLLLAACGQRAHPAQTEHIDPSALSALDAQNKYMMTRVSLSFQEGVGFYMGTSFLDRTLCYYDVSNGVSGILCGDPSCAHDRADCGAYLDDCASLNYYDGMRYWVGADSQGGTDQYLWRSSLAGSEREKVKRLDFQEILLAYQPQQYTIHRGNLYILGVANLIEGGKAATRVSLLSSPLDDTEEFTVLFDETVETGIYPAIHFIEDYVYLSLETSQDDAMLTFTIIQFDMLTGNSETIFQETDIQEALGTFWVTEQRELYLTGNGQGHAYLWKLENNNRVEIASWERKDSAALRLMDGIVVYSWLEGSSRKIVLRDFSGNIIYSGPMFPNGIAGIAGDLHQYAIWYIGGDRDKIILNLQDIMGMAESGASDMKNYTILLDVQNNLKPTILWSSADGGA